MKLSHIITTLTLASLMAAPAFAGNKVASKVSAKRAPASAAPEYQRRSLNEQYASNPANWGDVTHENFIAVCTSRYGKLQLTTFNKNVGDGQNATILSVAFPDRNETTGIVKPPVVYRGTIEANDASAFTQRQVNGRYVAVVAQHLASFGHGGNLDKAIVVIAYPGNVNEKEFSLEVSEKEGSVQGYYCHPDADEFKNLFVVPAR